MNVKSIMKSNQEHFDHNISNMINSIDKNYLAKFATGEQTLNSKKFDILPTIDSRLKILKLQNSKV